MIDADRFAADWIAAWNAHNLPAIVAHYADDVEFRSPMVTRLTGDPAGLVRGRAALGDYFARGLEQFPTLHFTLRGVLAGAGGLALDYETVDGLLACETMEFDGDDRVVRSSAHYRQPDGDAAAGAGAGAGAGPGAAARADTRPAELPNIHRPDFDELRDHPEYVARRARIGYQLATERLGLSLWELPAGQAAYPYHAHLAEEEVVVVLSGNVALRQPDGWRELHEGDVVSFAQGLPGAHQIVNRGAGPARFLAVSTNGQPDVVLYPEWGKVFAGERRPRGGGVRLFFHEDDAVDYFAGAQPPPSPPDG